MGRPSLSVLWACLMRLRAGLRTAPRGKPVELQPTVSQCPILVRNRASRTTFSGVAGEGYPVSPQQAGGGALPSGNSPATPGTDSAFRPDIFSSPMQSTGV